MIPWTLEGRALIPGGRDELLLWRRGDEFSIRIRGYVSELMNSRVHGSEEQLARLGCAPLQGRPNPHVLIGGLGMGYTLAAALQALPGDARVTVAELVPEVVEWNQGDLGACAGRPLEDRRVEVAQGDVARLLRSGPPRYDAVLLDVDNGPESMTHKDNDWLYSLAGLQATRQVLTPGGVLAVWSAAPDDRFTARVRRAGYTVEVHAVRARAGGKGARHTVWVARRP
ncbi:hypothetical protein [Deinococcus sonorensis]|uniref:Spermidine synthase n=2 Tax=Deinococcus sonorensis TaxID=309891 RepID=A0AAU7UD16_9DEIO